MTAKRPLLGTEEVWRKYDRMEARLNAPLSARMLDLAGVGPGLRVLDLATGRGEPAIPAAHRVGPTGSVLGIDLADRILAMARERAAEEGLTNLDLRVLSAQELETFPSASFDVALCRWGLMYFDAPVDALVGVRRALTPDGVLVVAVLGEVERASYFALPRRVLERYFPVPPIDPEAPGSFHYGDVAKLRRDLERGGFHVENVEELELPVMEAETVAEVIAWTRAFGMTRILDGAPEEIQQAWEADLAKAAEDLREPDGFIRLGAVSRIVVARPMSH